MPESERPVSQKKPILISGIQPTNNLTLGNYLGAIKKIKKVQDQYQTFLFIADWHAITIPLTFHQFKYQEISEFRKEIVKIYLASGIDPQKVIIFTQSEIKAHLELFYLLLTHCGLGELKRMTQFKDLSKKFREPNGTEIELMGLLVYPVLMAADILIYDSKYVAVGDDQIQHLELTRDIAKRINKKYKKKLFTIPEILMKEEVGNKIKDLQDPLKKMSKSSKDPTGTIFLNDPPEMIREKIMKAKTDSYNKISLNKEEQPGIYNLISIYSAINELTLEEGYQRFKNSTYLELKSALADSLTKELSEIQERYQKIKDQDVLELLEKNRKICQEITSKKIEEIYQNL